MNDQHEELERKQRIEYDIKLINAVLGSLESIFLRQRNTRDPVIRYSMFLDKLMTAIDVGVGMARVELDNEDYPQELKDRFELLACNLHADLNDLMNWVQNPVYSPDHPYGNQMMNEAKERFDSR